MSWGWLDEVSTAQRSTARGPVPDPVCSASMQQCIMLGVGNWERFDAAGVGFGCGCCGGQHTVQDGGGGRATAWLVFSTDWDKVQGRVVVGVCLVRFGLVGLSTVP